MDVNIRQANVEIRTVKLTKALLKQFRKLRGTEIPDKWLDENREFKPEFLIGWFRGTVLGEEFQDFTLLTNNNGDYFIYAHVSNSTRKNCKQIYIT